MGARNYYPSRWLTLAAAIVFLLFSGLIYGFSLFSSALKDRLDLTQSQMATIDSIGTFGASAFSVVAGLFSNRYGPQISIFIGSAGISIGWALLTAVTTQFFALKSWAVVCFFFVIFKCGMAWYSVVPIALCAQNFPPNDRGKFLGLGKAYIGIGTAFVAAFKSDLANENVDTFMISMMFFIPISSFIASWFLVLLPPKLATNYLPNEIKWGTEKRCGLSIALWYIAAFIFAVYLVVLSVVLTVYDVNAQIRYILFAVLLCLWLCPWILALCFHGDRWIDFRRFGSFGIADSESLNMNLLSDHSANRNHSADDGANDDHHRDSNDQSIGMPDIFRYWQLYAMYVIIGSVNGTAICFIDNLAQIIESASSDAVHDIENNHITTSLLAIVSFGSFCGRIIAGFVVDYVTWYHCSFWMILPALLMTVIQTVLFFGGTNVVVIQGSGLFIGISLGWMFTSLIVCVSDLWGTRYLSGNFSIFVSADALFVFLFSRVIFASIYDHFAKEQEDDIQYFEGTKCYGADCYKWTFLICGACSFVALILSVINWRHLEKRRVSKDCK